jgi:hypothetical protein
MALRRVADEGGTCEVLLLQRSRAAVLSTQLTSVGTGGGCLRTQRAHMHRGALKMRPTRLLRLLCCRCETAAWSCCEGPKPEPRSSSELPWGASGSSYESHRPTQR